jgi:hypothetical protein
MPPAPTWRDVAATLAERLANHAACLEHPVAAAQPDTCPACADRRAVELFRRKARAYPALVHAPVRVVSADNPPQ